MNNKITQFAMATEAQYVARENEIIEVEISKNILGGSVGLLGVDDSRDAW